MDNGRPQRKAECSRGILRARHEGRRSSLPSSPQDPFIRCLVPRVRIIIIVNSTEFSTDLQSFPVSSSWLVVSLAAAVNRYWCCCLCYCCALVACAYSSRVCLCLYVFSLTLSRLPVRKRGEGSFCCCCWQRRQCKEITAYEQINDTG